MALVTSNAQGELDPLEIGIHAFEAVPTNKGKSGGGLQAYASLIGKAKSTITELRNAGEVVYKMSSDIRTHLLGKVYQLSAIHKLPREAWQVACEWLSKNESSVVERSAKQFTKGSETFTTSDSTDSEKGVRLETKTADPSRSAILLFSLRRSVSIMAHEAKKTSHRTEPPCNCDSCLRETAKADQQRAYIFDMLRRLATEDEWRFVEAEVRR